MDYIILLFSCIAEYLIFSDFFDAFLTIRPNFQPIRNRILIAIPFIGIYFGINTLQLSYLNMIAFICLILLYSFLYEASLKERLLYIVFLCAIFFGCEFLFAVLLNLPAYLFHSSSVANLSTIPWQIFTLKLLTYLICCLYKQTSVRSSAHMDRKMLFVYSNCMHCNDAAHILFRSGLRIISTHADIALRIFCDHAVWKHSDLPRIPEIYRTAQSQPAEQPDYLRSVASTELLSEAAHNG